MGTIDPALVGCVMGPDNAVGRQRGISTSGARVVAVVVVAVDVDKVYERVSNGRGGEAGHNGQEGDGTSHVEKRGYGKDQATASECGVWMVLLW